MGTAGAGATRRKRALMGCAALAALAGVVVGSGVGDEAPPPTAPPTICERTDSGALSQIAGQRVMVRMEARATPDLLEQARSGGIGGVILFPPSEIQGDRLTAEIGRLQGAAREGGNPPLLIAIDQEGGVVERLPALAPQLSPYTLGQVNKASSARLEGRATGFQLGELGVNVNLAPVMDVPSSEAQFMTPRAFGNSPGKVARLALAFADGQRSEAMASTAKHFPGLGRAIENTDFAPTSINASRRVLTADIEPFRAAAEAGIELTMISSATYPRLKSGEVPAVLSSAIATDLLRGELGFAGVTISDDLLAPAIALSYSRGDSTIRAAAAGVDILLYAARDVTGVASTLTQALASGELEEDSMRASCGRILALKDSVAASR